MGQMQRRKRLGREVMGLARRKVTSPKLVCRRFAESAERLVKAFISLGDAIEKAAGTGLLPVPHVRGLIGLPAKTFDKRIMPP